MELCIEIHHAEPDIAILQVSGKLKLGAERDQLEKQVASLLLRNQRRLVVDLAGVDRIDSAGIGTLAQCAYRASRAGAGLRVAGGNQHVQKLLDMVGLNLVIDCFPRLEDALRNFPVRQPGDKARW